MLVGALEEVTTMIQKETWRINRPFAMDLDLDTPILCLLQHTVLCTLYIVHVMLYWVSYDVMWCYSI